MKCPHCDTGVSTWRAGWSPRHIVTCENCGAKLYVKGIWPSYFLAEIFMYVVIAIPFIIAPDHFLLDLVLMMALMFANYYLCFVMLVHLEPMKTSGNKKSP